jgi:putative hemolysin
MDISIGYRFLLVALIIVLNAFFSGSEVALISVRQSRLRQLAEEGQVGAQAALNLLSNPERLLSVVQVGVTLTSLGLGWAGEGTVYTILLNFLGPLITPETETLLHGLSFAIAFLIITYLHVVLGEVVPKNLAIEKADKLAMLVAPLLLIFYRVVTPFVTVIERSATGVSKALGLSGEASSAGHTKEEIKFILAASRRHGHLGEFEEQAVLRILELGELSAREVMVPRNDIVSVSVEASLDELLKVVSESKYARVPVWEGARENILGIVYLKDLLELWYLRRQAKDRRRAAPPFQIRRLLRKPLYVPETKLLPQLLQDFRENNAHMALVVDEFGTVSGLITLEDVLEQVFGEIEDEHDLRLKPFPVIWESLELEGATPIRDLETQYGIELPSDAGFETLAGFLLFRLGAIPKPGDSVLHQETRFTILEMDRNRIVRVLIEKPEHAATGTDA